MEWTVQKNGKIDVKMGDPILKSEIRFQNHFFHFSELSIPFEIYSCGIFQDFRIFPFKAVREHPKTIACTMLRLKGPQ